MEDPLIFGFWETSNPIFLCLKYIASDKAYLLILYKFLGWITNYSLFFFSPVVCNDRLSFHQKILALHFLLMTLYHATQGWRVEDLGRRNMIYYYCVLYWSMFVCFILFFFVFILVHMLEYLSAYLLQLFVHFLLVCLYPSFIIKSWEEELHLHSKNDYGSYRHKNMHI